MATERKSSYVHSIPEGLVLPRDWLRAVLRQKFSPTHRCIILALAYEAELNGNPLSFHPAWLDIYIAPGLDPERESDKRKFFDLLRDLSRGGWVKLVFSATNEHGRKTIISAELTLPTGKSEVRS